MKTYKHTLKLHRWTITISSKAKNIVEAVSEHVIGFKKLLAKKKLPSSSRHTTIELRVEPMEGLHFRKRLQAYQYEELVHPSNIIRAYDFKRNRAIVFYPKELQTSSPLIYHAFFLQPLSQIFRAQACSLIHGAILSYQGRGVMLVGSKGAGKSSLSAALIELGFDYYGDEHPILSLEKNTVFGRGFPSAIALDERSKQSFLKWDAGMTWHHRRGKYLLDPIYIRKKSIGKKCEISKVIFLNSNGKNNLKLQQLSHRELFLRMLKDDYLTFHDVPIRSNESLSHLDLIARLAEQAPGYELKYGDKDFRRLAAIIRKELVG